MGGHQVGEDLGLGRWWWWGGERGPKCPGPTGRQPLKRGGWQPQKEAGLSPTERDSGDPQPHGIPVSGGCGAVL